MRRVKLYLPYTKLQCETNPHIAFGLQMTIEHRGPCIVGGDALFTETDPRGRPKGPWPPPSDQGAITHVKVSSDWGQKYKSAAD